MVKQEYGGIGHFDTILYSFLAPNRQVSVVVENSY